MSINKEAQTRVSPFVQIPQFFIMLIVLISCAGLVGYGLKMLLN